MRSIEMRAMLADLICFVIGSFLTIGSLLGLAYHFDLGLGLREKASYYYPFSLSATKIGLGIGMSLICLGILIRYHRKYASSDARKKGE